MAITQTTIPADPHEAADEAALMAMLPPELVARIDHLRDLIHPGPDCPVSRTRVLVNSANVGISQWEIEIEDSLARSAG